MNRREFLAASTAAAAVTLSPTSAFALPPDGSPANLLHDTFTPLASSLLAPQTWKPLPAASDRAAWTALPADVRAALIKRADGMLTTPWEQLLATDELEFRRTGNRTHYEGISFGRRHRLGSLVLAECVARDGKYLDQIANGIWLICEETFWGAQAHLGAQHAGTGLADASEPIIELFSAETAATLAWVLYLLGPELKTVSPLLEPRIRMETKRRIFDPYLTRDDFWWMGLDTSRPPEKQQHLNNWNPWINSNVLTAALFLEPTGPRRSQIVEKVTRSVDRFLSEYSPDAACEEGPGYWSRSAASYFDVCTTLVSAHANKGASILTHPFVKAMGHYIVDVHIAHNEYVDYGDAHIHASPEPEMLYSFGRATGDAILMAFGAFEAARQGTHFGGNGGGPASLSREIAKVFTISGMASAAKQDALPRDAWYPKLGLMTARETEAAADGFYVAMQSASNGRPHGHNDSGSFMVFRNGDPIFIDVGVGTYTASTFGKDRYTLWPMQSAFHNLPTIGLGKDAIMQHEGYAYTATDLKYSKSDAATITSANLAPAYPKEASLHHWNRTLKLDRTNKRVELTEDFALAKESAITLTFMCAKEPTLTPEGVRTNGVLLAFDPALKPSIEKLDLTDPLLKSSWGNTIWRVLLTSSPTKSATWHLTISA